MAVTPKAARTRTESSTSVRIESDLYEAAKVAGSHESRSAAQQLDYWARVGRRVADVGTVARERIVRAVAGELPLAELSREEGIVANAEIDEAVIRHATTSNYADLLNEDGLTAVWLDAEGHMIRRGPDGVEELIG